MSTDINEAMAALVQATRGTRPGAVAAQRLTQVTAAMRLALERIAAESLFDTEPAQLAAVLSQLAEPEGDGP